MVTLIDTYIRCDKCVDGIIPPHSEGYGGSVISGELCTEDGCLEGWKTHDKIDAEPILGVLTDILDKVNDIKEKLEEP